MRLRNFPGITYSESPEGIIRIFWRENGRQFSRTFHSWTSVMSFLGTLYPQLATHRVEQSKVVQPVASLSSELIWYQGRLVRSRQQDDSEHTKNALGAIRRLIRLGDYVLPLDVTPESFDHLIAQRTENKGGFLSDLRVFQTFLRRLQEKGVTVNQQILAYRIPKSKKQRIHFPWSAAEISQWWSYLSRGMELLADCDVSWSWHDRIQQRCLTYEFAQRMRLIPLYLVQSRYLIRPSESRRLTADDWDCRRGTLNLNHKIAKWEPKICLVDRESAWLFEVCAKGGISDKPLFQSPDGLKWSSVTHQSLWRRHLVAAGLADKKPYDVKYTTATYMFDHPDEFSATNIEERIDRVRAITGHTKHSKSTEDYIQSLWGSAYHLQVRDFFNRHRLFPFRVEDFPVSLPTPAANNGSEEQAS